MTLKKDAVVCVSLAGLVLIMAAFSRTTPRSEIPAPLNTSENEVFHRPLYKLYVEAVNNINDLGMGDREFWLQKARRQVADWYQGHELSAPIDLFRAAAILGTSTEADELDLAHELSLQAWSKGVRTAKRLALETQDRLLLSVGQGQRYGTQAKWQGKALPTFGEPSTELTPTLRSDLGLDAPATSNRSAR